MSDLVSRMKCSWKRKHASERIALKRAEHGHDGRPLFVYRCPHCKFYHLTSKPQRMEKRK